MFVDVVTIKIQAGKGGDGAVHFRREKFVPNGGPDGGNGGRGGSIIFVVDEGVHTLMEFRRRRLFKAQHGVNGQGSNKYGKSGSDLYIKVPIGTLIKDAETDTVLADMSDAGREKLILKGGKGGRGNMHFSTPTRQAPRFATKGQDGEGGEVSLELKTIADVGLIGYPNVGKSTMLSVLSAARPKIANYHFTTLSPNLGLVRIDEERSFFMADIPGLIDGAAKGIGLGHDFLRHVERTRMLVHVIDVSGSENRDPVEDFHHIMKELKEYSPVLSELPQIIAANKTDILIDNDNLTRLIFEVQSMGIKVFPISAVTNKGLKPLINHIYDMLLSLPPVKIYDEEDPAAIFGKQNEEPFTVNVIEDGVYELKGPQVDYFINRTNLDDYDSLQYFHRMLRRKGMIRALRKAGAKEGDTVIIDEMEFDYVE